MDRQYYEVTSQLDAREILRYLNNLGIHNISGEVLKYFITDLKKLIKYDLENRSRTESVQDNEEAPGLERLHSASTFSSRIRSKNTDGIVLKCSRECHIKKRAPNVRVVQSVPNLVPHEEEKPLRRACSCIRVERKPESRGDSAKERTAPTSNNNIIRVAMPPVQKKCDPVALYHYYTSLWAKYKPNVPGENDWADLRWSIRQKMAGSEVKPTSSRTSEVQSHDRNVRITKLKL